jgi:DNA-binding NarL/FixJ family response regulator
MINPIGAECLIDIGLGDLETVRAMQFFIADDHELIRESLAHLLREAWGEETEVVGLPDFTDLLSALSDHGPGDVVIMDLKMPGMQGAHSVEILKARYPALPVLVLSGLFRHADVLAAMNAGAEGFVSKASGGEVLLEAVRLVLAGGTYVTNEALGDDNARSDPTGPFAALTRREQDLLGLIAQGKTNKEIALDLGIREPTVKVHVKSIFRKLGVFNRTQAARLALDSGMVA